jgi:hypothetical protein
MAANHVNKRSHFRYGQLRTNGHGIQPRQYRDMLLTPGTCNSLAGDVRYVILDAKVFRRLEERLRETEM